MIDLYAARLHDPVGHDEEFALQVIGMALGLALGIVLIFGGLLFVGSGFGAPVGIAAIILGVIEVLAIGETAAGIAGLLKEVLPWTETGNINQGAQSVFVGEANKPFARVRDACECEETPLNVIAKLAVLSAVLFPAGVGAAAAYAAYLAVNGISHDPSEIRTGSTKVHVEGQHAARRSSETSCGGFVIDGEHSVVVFGKGDATGIEKRSTVPAAWAWALWAISIVAFFKAIAQIILSGLKVTAIKGLPDLWKLLKNGLREELKNKKLPGKVWWALSFLLGNPFTDKFAQMKFGKDSKGTKIFGAGTKINSAGETLFNDADRRAALLKVLKKVVTRK